MIQLPEELVNEIKPKEENVQQEQETQVETQATTEANADTQESTQAQTETNETSQETQQTAQATTEDTGESDDDNSEGIADEYISSIGISTTPAQPTTEQNESDNTTTKNESSQTTEANPQLEAVQEILKDPAFRWIQEIRGQGKDPIEELRNINGADPSKLTSKEVYEKQLRELAAKNGYEEDRIQDYLERFEDQDPVMQENTVAAYRAKMEEQYKQVRESLKPTVNLEEVAKKQQEQQMAVYNKAIQDIDSFASANEGKNFYGLEWTKERLGAVRKHLTESPEAIVINRADGSVDVEASIEINAMKMYIGDIVKKAITSTKNATTKKVLNERHNTSSDQTNRTPQNNQIHPLDQYLESESKKRGFK